MKSLLYFCHGTSLSGACHPAELVCLVFTNEKAWGKHKAPLLQVQLFQAAAEREQHGSECPSWAPVQQWQHHLQLPCHGEPVLPTAERPGQQRWQDDLPLSRRYWACAKESFNGHSSSDGEDPGGSSVHSDAVQEARWGWRDLQWMEVCSCCHRQIMSGCIYPFCHHLHIYNTHVCSKFYRSCFKGFCIRFSKMSMIIKKWLLPVILLDNLTRIEKCTYMC